MRRDSGQHNGGLASGGPARCSSSGTGGQAEYVGTDAGKVAGLAMGACEGHLALTSKVSL